MTKGKITFVANDSTKGDGTDPSTMDYFGGTQYPWLSLAVPKLREMGYDVEVVSWQDRSVDWKSKSLVIIGPVWGYSKQQRQFDHWLQEMKQKKIPLINSPEFIIWNFKKTYLKDLQEGGIAIPPTIIIAPDSNQSLAETLEQTQREWGTKDVVVKGVVDAAAFGFRHVNSVGIGVTMSEEEFAARHSGQKPANNDAHFETLKKENNGVVVQPFLPEIAQKGELSFVFFNGEFSHSFIKVPKQGEKRVQPFYGGRSFHINETDLVGSIAAIKKEFRPNIVVTEDDIKIGKRQAAEIAKKLPDILGKKGIKPPLYVRIDGAMVNGQFQVMEIEGLEPYMEMKEAILTSPQNDVVGKYAAAIDNAYQIHRQKRSSTTKPR